MPFFAEFYGPDTLDVMTHALKEAMDESAGKAPPGSEVNIVMANRIMAAVAAGERDIDAMKRAALSALATPASKSAA